MAKPPLVSVIVPIYNVEKYIEECFESLAAQSYKNIEIILVDDGSTDRSGEIVVELASIDQRVKLISKQNGGLSDARNAGMRVATGEYVTFIDSDDYVGLEYVEQLVSIAEMSGADIVQCNNSRDSSDLGSGDGSVLELSGHVAFVKLLKYEQLSPTAWGKLYKLSLFKSNSLEFPVGRIHEDTAILYKLVYLANKVTCLRRVLYYYRINEKSIMNGSYNERHYSSVVSYHGELDSFILKEKIVIDDKVIYRHKALRLLSVLNKLAVSDMDGTDTYADFASDYRLFATKARSVSCYIGSVPVALPVIFRWLRGLTPTIRKVIGKS